MVDREITFAEGSERDVKVLEPSRRTESWLLPHAEYCSRAGQRSKGTGGVGVVMIDQDIPRGVPG